MLNRILSALTIAAIISIFAYSYVSYSQNPGVKNDIKTTQNKKAPQPTLISKLTKSYSNNINNVDSNSSSKNDTSYTSGPYHSSSSNNNSTYRSLGTVGEIIYEELIAVDLIINTGNNTYKYNVSVPQGSSVYDLLKTASSKHKFSLKAKNYSYGVFIEEIHGVANNPSKAMYWIYYVNSKTANQGASLQKVKKGDDILWKYQKTN